MSNQAENIPQENTNRVVRHHMPVTWFREHSGTIHWRCHACGNTLPSTAMAPAVTGVVYVNHFGACMSADDREALFAAMAEPCPGPYPRVRPKLTPDRDQLGYVVRASWVEWAQTQPQPKRTWLVPYEDLPVDDQEADQKIGWDTAKWVLKTLIDWRGVELTEGEVCRRLGMDRMEWRVTRDQLGITQQEEG